MGRGREISSFNLGVGCVRELCMFNFFYFFNHQTRNERHYRTKLWYQPMALNSSNTTV